MATGSSNLKVPTMRITRARAKTLGSSGGLPPLHPSVRQDKKQGLVTQGTKSKRPAPDENKPANSSSTASQQHKRRAVLRDVTNVLCENPYMNCINGNKFQVSVNRCVTSYWLFGNEIIPAEHNYWLLN